MSNIKPFLFLLFFLVLGFKSYTQKIMYLDGELSLLKGVSLMAVEYDYSSYKVGNLSEEDFLEMKVNKLNKEKAGKGDLWKEEWFSSRERYEKKFQNLFNKTQNKTNLSIHKGGTGDFVLKVKVTFIEPGFKAYRIHNHTKINFEFLIVNATDSNKIAAKLYLPEVEGIIPMTHTSNKYPDEDMMRRITESFARGGKILSAYLEKKTK